MTFDQLETFLTICKVNNFTRAANELNITQPAVTARISSLEQELDCQLFTINKTKKPTLTKEGELFLNYAKKMVHDMYEAKQAIILSQRPKLGLGFPPNFSSQIIIEFLSILNIKDTYISIKKGVDSDELLNSLMNNDLALAFVYNAISSKDLIVEEIIKTNMKFLIGKNHPLALEDRITPELLNGETMICYARNTKVMANIEEKLKSQDLNKIEVHDVETLKGLLGSGLGFGILPELSITDNDKEFLCIKPFELLEDLSLDLFAVYKNDISYDKYLEEEVTFSIDTIKKLICTYKMTVSQ